MAKVTLKGYILVPEKDLQEVRRELINHRRLTLNEPGCISFTVTESAENPLRFDVLKSLSTGSPSIFIRPACVLLAGGK